MPKIKHYENIHIPLWLLKDTCWMMQWKTLGIILMIPTVLVALIITLKYVQEKLDEFWVHLAVLFWISGNSYWMVCEFVDREDLKYYAAIPFVLGMASVIVYYQVHYVLKRR